MTSADCAAPSKTAAAGVSWRALAIGLLAIVAVVFWIHWAEIVLGSRRGHSALANTSVPVGAFFAFMCVVGFNAILARLRKTFALSRAELLTIYTMGAVATVLASSGAIHFLVPAVASPYYFASPANKWEIFHPYIPTWFAPANKSALRGYFEGGAPIPWQIWLVPSITWSLFVVAYALCSLGISGILHRQWVAYERLTFPTASLPIAATSVRDFWRRRTAWIGLAVPVLVGALNTLNLNFPAVPKLEVRNIDLSQHFRDRPWNAMGGLRLSLYPFVIGVAFLLSSEVTFSCWFFYLLTKFQRIVGASLGLENWGRSVTTRFPFEPQQGAGAFLALAAMALYIGRRHISSALAATLRWASTPDVPAWALATATVAFAALVAFCAAAGMAVTVAAALLGLSLLYLIAASRIRAETGDAWLFGPQLDPQALLVTSLGARRFQPRDLTVMAFLSTISSFDLRCTSMPHQLDAFKIADVVGIDARELARALAVGIIIGVPTAWVAALKVWHIVGAVAKGEPWRLSQGRRAFETLTSYLLAPQPADYLSTIVVAASFFATLALFALRARIVNWPLHPVGYAVANTPSMHSQWFPFFIAWCAKVALLKYGGHTAYRSAVPFSVGLVIGDLLTGGLTTLIACFNDAMRVYPINW
ncbi:MAG: hypothetical protein H5T86_03005 [Armatimonadetes bacterium]|nr:hypothetical protein [Armatimonadota bacterium]